MAVLYGPGDLKNRILPVGWDAIELEKLRSESNISIEEITNLFVAAQVGLNAELVNDPVMSLMFNVTTEPAIDYPTGTTNTMSAHTEYVTPDIQRGEVTGHMLPRKPFDYALGWTWDLLRRVRRSQIIADIAGMINAGRNRWEVNLLTRFTKDTDDTGASKGLGATGISPGFAHDEASTGVDYVPLPWKGLTFDNTHEHYNATNSTTAANWIAAIKAMTLHLFHHGHPAPYILMISNSDQNTVIGLTDFTPRASAEIRYGATQDLALVGEEYIGTISTLSGIALVYVQNRLPQYSMLMFKARGMRSPRAPMAVRFSDDIGLVLAPLLGKGIRRFPIEGLLSFAEFGVGVNDRTNGVCHQMNTASYSAPTIT